MACTPFMRAYHSLASTMARLGADRRGGVSLEYGLIISFVIVGFLGGLTLFGGSNGGAWDTMTGKLIAVIKGN